MIKDSLEKDNKEDFCCRGERFGQISQEFGKEKKHGLKTGIVEDKKEFNQPGIITRDPLLEFAYGKKSPF